MHTGTRVLLSIENRIALVQLNRPEKHNALDMEMFGAIAAVQKKLSQNKDIRAVVLAGAGVDFCTGLDVKSVMKDRMGMVKLLWKWSPWRANLAQRVSVGWREIPVPVFAAVQGRCWGGGLQIALGADFRFVQPTASLSIMEGKWGLIPDMGGTLALRELTSRDHAMLLAMTADLISGEEAKQLGLATRLAENPVAAAMEIASRIVERSPDAVAAVKRLYRKSWSGSDGKALARESLYQVRVLSGRNQRIAVRRQFGDKAKFQRPAKW